MVFWAIEKFFVIGENLRKQALSENLDAAHSQKRSKIQEF